MQDEKSSTLQSSLLGEQPPAQSRKLRVLVIAALFLTQISSAGYGLLTKNALTGDNGVNALVFSLARDALSFPLLELMALVVDGGGKGVWRPKRQHVLRFLFMGIFGMFGNQFCYILGLVYIDAGLASVVNLMTPICAW